MRFQFKLKREYSCLNRYSLFKPVSCRFQSENLHFRVGVKTVSFWEKILTYIFCRKWPFRDKNWIFFELIHRIDCWYMTIFIKIAIFESKVFFLLGVSYFILNYAYVQSRSWFGRMFLFNVRVRSHAVRETSHSMSLLFPWKTFVTWIYNSYIS